MTENVELFNMVHKLSFIKDLERSLKVRSNQNMTRYSLDICGLGDTISSRDAFPNKRPLHLFGIETENQKNAKHLMGDFFNAISLSLIPVVVVPEEKMEHLMKMLEFNKTIKDLKDLGLYDS